MSVAECGMSSDKGMKMAGAMAVVAGRAIRPCDVCGRKRARLYCAADEAYLCEACDTSVHAANAVALRHERVRLAPNGTPLKMDRRNINTSSEIHHPPPAPLPLKKKPKNLPNTLPPPGPVTATAPQQQGNPGAQLREVKVELGMNNVLEPADDHFTAEELTGNANLDDESYDDCSTTIPESDFAHDFLVSDPNDCNNSCSKNFQSNYSSLAKEDDAKADGIGNRWMELDLGDRDLSDDDEYNLDLEALRGSVSDTATCDTTNISSSDYHENKPAANDPANCGVHSSRTGKPFKNIAGQSEWVKIEQQHHGSFDNSMGLGGTCKMEGLNECDLRQVPSLLRLDYADVLSSWPDRGMLWTDEHGNTNPQFVPDSSNSDIVGSCYDLGLVPNLSPGGLGAGGGHVATMYGGGGGSGSSGLGPGLGEDSNVNTMNGREARVIRYREKRRTRLFSKKIRYEVRKLNAERRPRMKGRFVKRSPGRE